MQKEVNGRGVPLKVHQFNLSVVWRPFFPLYHFSLPPLPHARACVGREGGGWGLHIPMSAIGRFFDVLRAFKGSHFFG